MTVDWQPIQEALVSFVASAEIVEPGHVWPEREAHAVPEGSFVSLQIGSERAVGNDDVEWVELEDEEGTYEVPKVTGIREFTVSFMLRSRSQAPASSARTGLETLRASLHHPVRMEPLRAAGIAFLSSEDVRPLDYLADERWESIAVLDVHFSVVSTLLDERRTAAAEAVEAAQVAINGGNPEEITAE